jgi:alkylation response protein AidB-like acyl-CoA dehydrogenase
LIDWSTVKSLEKPNYYLLNPNLQALAAKYISKEDDEIIPEMLKTIGQITGNLAKTAKENDEKGCRLIDGYTVELSEGIQKSLEHIIQTGLIGATIKDYGLGLSHILKIASEIMLAEADTAISLTPMLTGGVARIIELFGTEEQKEKYLRRLCLIPEKPEDIKNAYTGAMVMTEPDAGSDLGNIKTKAVKNGNYYEIFGTKTFITNPQSDILLVLARTEKGAKGLGGLSLFIVPKEVYGELNKYKITRLEQKLGLRGSPTGEMLFEGAIGYLIGIIKERAKKDSQEMEEIGEGFKIMANLVNESRLGIAAQALGIAERAYLEAATYSTERKTFGKQIIEHPAVAEMLATMRVNIEAYSAVVFRNAHFIDKINETDKTDKQKYKALIRILTPLCKYVCSEMSIRIAKDAVQIHGGYGYVKEYNVERLLRDAPITTIYEGTSEIMVLDVLRTMKTEQSLLYLMDDIDETLATVEDSCLKELGEIIKEEINNARSLINKAGIGPLHPTGFDQAYAKELANKLMNVYASTLLLQEAQEQLPDKRKMRIAQLFISKNLIAAKQYPNISLDIKIPAYYNAIINYGKIED